MIPIQYIITENKKWDTISHVKAAIKAGCKWIQLRPNAQSDKKYIKSLQKIKDLCREQDVTFIIEDHADLVKAIDGDGIHITNEQTLAEVRQTLGEGYLIGATAHNAEEAIQMKKQSADYIVCGPFSSTTSNEANSTMLSLSDYSKIVSTLEAESIFIPLCAYGEISPSDVQPILETGIRGLSLYLDDAEMNEGKVVNALQPYFSL